MTSRYKLIKIFVDGEDYEKFINIFNEYYTPLQTQIEVLKYLKKLDGSSLRQLSRLTGLTVNKIFKV